MDTAYLLKVRCLIFDVKIICWDLVTLPWVDRVTDRDLLDLEGGILI